MSKSVESTGGIGFFGLLAIALITLKLTGYISWSWLWVLAPIWLPTTVFVIGGVIYLFWLASKYSINNPNRQ